MRKGLAEGMSKGLAKGLAEGELSEARKMLLRLGQTHFRKAPPAEVRAQVEAMQDLPQLEELLLRVPQLRAWSELLPPSGQPRRRKRSQ